MQEIFSSLTPADYLFVSQVISSPLNISDDAELRRRVLIYEASGKDEDRMHLDVMLEREIRYLGSADAAYLARLVTGQEPGVTFREILRDVAHALKVRPDRVGTDREMLEDLVRQYASQTFADLKPEEQQKLLEDLGVEKEKAKVFLKRSAGVFALPVMIQVFNAVVVEALIKRIILGAIAKLIGQQMAKRLFLLIAGRFPWWLSWVGPAAWTASIGWTAIDLQGPAMRKTIPTTLYLGLCCLRSQQSSPAASRPVSP